MKIETNEHKSDNQKVEAISILREGTISVHSPARDTLPISTQVNLKWGLNFIKVTVAQLGMFSVEFNFH